MPDGNKCYVCLARGKYICVETMKLMGNVGGGGVEDESHFGGMGWRVADKYAHSRSAGPLVVGFLCLKLWFKKIHRGVKWVEILEVGVDFETK